MPLPDDVDPRMLDGEVRTELRSLSKDTADLVARHLVMTGRLLDDDPEAALQHARAARALAGRVGAVREACGLAAYTAGEWADALNELRAARRITGRPDHLAVLADCERALDRPERALSYADDPDVARLGQAERVELVIVLAGARRDLGQSEAAVLELQGPARRTKAGRPWAARLWYAYADALLGAGRETEAREWFASAADADPDDTTDAAERLLELDGVVFADLEEGDDWIVGDGAPPEPPVASARPVEAAREADDAAATAAARGVIEDSVAAVTPAEDARRADALPADARPTDAPAADAPAAGVPAPGFAPESPAVEDQDSPPAPAPETIPAVTFTAPDDDGEMRLFD